MRRSHTSPTTGDREEYVRSLGNELRLNFRGEHQVSVSLLSEMPASRRFVRPLGSQRRPCASLPQRLRGLRQFVENLVRSWLFVPRDDFYRDRVVAVAGRNTSWSFGENARLRTNVVLTKQVMDDAEKIMAITTN